MVPHIKLKYLIAYAVEIVAKAKGDIVLVKTLNENVSLKIRFYK